MKSQISNYNKISISKHSWLKAAKPREESLVIPQLNATGQVKKYFLSAYWAKGQRSLKK